MAANDYLADLIGPLKRAAIDAFMCRGNLGGLGWEITADRYTNISVGSGQTGMTEEVTRPGADGEGGGDSKTVIAMCPDRHDPGKYANDFDAIRSRIDEAIQRWSSLPDPGEIVPLVESMRQANRVLSLGPSSTGGALTGGGAIGGNINLINENSDAMAGGMITAFKTNFLSQLGTAVSGQHAITVILGSVLAAEEKIWEGAQQTVLDLINKSTEAFNSAAAEGASVNWDVVLKVVGYALSGASIFATGGAVTALKVADVGLDILSGSIPQPDDGEKTDSPGDDYDSVMSAFETVLRDLDSRIETEEQILQDNLVTNLRQIRADLPSYDLSSPPIIDISDGSDLGSVVPGSVDELRIEPIRVREITETYLPNIAKELKTAAGHVSEAGSLTSLRRDSSIGLGTYGPDGRYYDLRFLLSDILDNLQARITYSAEALQLGAEDIGMADSQVRDALEKFSGRVHDRGIYTSSQVMGPWL